MSPQLQHALALRTRISQAQAPLGDLGSHIIDLAHYLCDDITEVSAAMATYIKERPAVPGSEEKKPVTVDDAVVMCVRSPTALLALSRRRGSRWDARTTIHSRSTAARGRCHSTWRTSTISTFCPPTTMPTSRGFAGSSACSKGKHPYADHWWADGHILGYEHSFTHSVNDFLTALTSGGEIHPDFEDGLKIRRFCTPWRRRRVHAAGSRSFEI